MKSLELAHRLRQFGISRHSDVHGWQKKFADELEVSPQQMSNMLSGNDSIGYIIQKRLYSLGCRDIILLRDMMPEESNQDPGSLFQMSLVKLVGKITATPDGKQYFEDFPDNITIPYRRGNYFALMVENDSLINAPDGEHSFEIYPGDICIFQSGRQPRNGDIVAVELVQSNQRMVKILKHKSDEEIELASANKFRNYPSQIVKKDAIASFGVLVSKVKQTRGELRALGIVK